MKRYYKIVPVASKNSNISDAIKTVADYTGKRANDILQMMGFGSRFDLLVYANRNTNPYFNVYAFVTAKLNDICKELDAPVRIIRPSGERRTNGFN